MAIVNQVVYNIHMTTEQRTTSRETHDASSATSEELAAMLAACQGFVQDGDPEKSRIAQQWADIKALGHVSIIAPTVNNSSSR